MEMSGKPQQAIEGTIVMWWLFFDCLFQYPFFLPIFHPTRTAVRNREENFESVICGFASISQHLTYIISCLLPILAGIVVVLAPSLLDEVVGVVVRKAGVIPRGFPPLPR